MGISARDDSSTDLLAYDIEGNEFLFPPFDFRGRLSQYYVRCSRA
jgi:hypothetical protein